MSSRPTRAGALRTWEATAQVAAPVVRGRRRPSWLPTAGLIALGLLPILASRLAALAAGEPLASGETLGGPLPALVHVVSAAAFVVLGAFQFSAGFRRLRPGWHRAAGRILVATGILVALSGLWLNHFGQRHGDLLYVARWLFGAAMILCLALGLRAILGRNVRGHRAWMIRAYALGLGAGTQVFALGFGQAVLGEAEPTEALLNVAAWVLNLAVAQLVIARRPRAIPAPRPGGGSSPAGAPLGAPLPPATATAEPAPDSR